MPPQRRGGSRIKREAAAERTSHAAAVAQSVKLIKKRLKWGWILERSRQLSVVLERPDLWDDPVFAGKETMRALADMRRSAKEKELNALLSGDNDSFSCFIEVQAGAGGTESMDWAAMIMNMYRSWAQQRGYTVTIVEEMPGEIVA
ncbi:hypothetical protein GUJ93_ZPchr0004g39467 [Zizania palustris]|uniref:Peptide chain release factor domain-containing protein n=1 Tax=Zizania palustris TaxID=103762 RepID=A0A8J5SI12_ZIZPA|nr:hypothetical protein GUJ93_ZPchr0004g39467 [Zizania palustris]